MMTLPFRSGKSFAGLKQVKSREPIVAFFRGTAGRIDVLSLALIF